MPEAIAEATRRTEKIPIALIPGDGIGPELMDSATAVLEAAVSGARLEFTVEEGGAQTYLRTGENLAAGALERFRGEYAAVLKGPVGLPGVRRPDGIEAGLLGGVLRGGLDTYANVRPITLLPGMRTPLGDYRSPGPGSGSGPERAPAGAIDYVIVRENTEGLYMSRGLGVGNDDAVVDQLFVSRRGVERVAHYAFRLARSRGGAPVDGVRRVTLVDKSNVLRSYALFRRVTLEVSELYPEIELDFRYSDAAAHDLVVDPGHFDVVLTENFIGDILSDLGAATVGGLGMCPSGNIGDGPAYFEPIHGSAPTIAGRNLANPISQILSAAMMLDFLDLPDDAARIRAAVRGALASGELAFNAAGQPESGTTGVTAAIIARLAPPPAEPSPGPVPLDPPHPSAANPPQTATSATNRHDLNGAFPPDRGGLRGTSDGLRETSDRRRTS